MNITESQYNGFWFTLKEEELTLGLIGDQLIEPVIIWNDTLREGPRDIKYFGLTTDQSSASFGVNCDVPNLHFPGKTYQGSDWLPEAGWASSNAVRRRYRPTELLFCQKLVGQLPILPTRQLRPCLLSFRSS